MRPALAITEGMFNDIGESNIKVGRKYGQNNRLLEDVIIHEKSLDQINRVVIKAKRGELKSEELSEGIQLVLYDGYRYEEVRQTKKPKKTHPHSRIAFEQYVMNIDLRTFNDVDLNEANYSNTFKMQNIGELSKSIDSLSSDYMTEIEAFANTTYLRTGIKSLHQMEKPLVAKNFSGRNDYLEKISNRDRNRVLTSAKEHVTVQLNSFSNQKNVFFVREKMINLHRLWRDDKFVTAYAALLLFFVGAPLGAIIRKGGFGLPIVVALTIFLTYHFAGTLFKNSAEDGSLHPFWGTWLTSIILTIVGIIAVLRATKDKSVFDVERLKLTLRRPLQFILKKTRNG